MEGRDIGTEVFPDALLKVFLTADLSIRAERRFNESSEQTLETVLEDHRNAETRSTLNQDSPLLVAPGAIIFDSSGLTIEDVVSDLATIFRGFGSWLMGTTNMNEDKEPTGTTVSCANSSNICSGVSSKLWNRITIEASKLFRRELVFGPLITVATSMPAAGVRTPPIEIYG